MAATKKAALNGTAKKAPAKRKTKTDSKPGDAAKAHDWLMQSQGVSTEGLPAKAEAGEAEVAGPTEIAVLQKDPQTGRFLPGNSGFGGRKKGSRSKLAEAFLTDLLHDWEQHGAQAIIDVRETKPDQYLKAVVATLPKQVDVRVSEYAELKDDALDGEIAKLMQELAVARTLLNPQGMAN